MEALRTKSYTEICSKIQGHRRTNSEERISQSPFTFHQQISADSLLEPRQDILHNILGNSSPLHHLILDYFQGSLEAFRLCGFLLHSINQTRAIYLSIQSVLRSNERAGGDYTKRQRQFIRAELASFLSLENPLLGSIPLQFRRVHDLYGSMFNRLTNTREKIIRKVKSIRFFKKALRTSLVIACGALAIVTLVLVAHALFGISASPLVMRRTKLAQQPKLKYLARFGIQLDAATKGAYILSRDFDTISRLVTRLCDEIEHSKAVISIFLRNDNKNLLEEVVKELRSNETGFPGQLEELQEHTYLCLLTINKARRLVVQKIRCNSSVNDN